MFSCEFCGFFYRKPPMTAYEVYVVYLWSLIMGWIRRDQYLSVFSLNAGKYGPEKTPYLDTFHAVPWKGNVSLVQIAQVTGFSVVVVLSLNGSWISFIIFYGWNKIYFMFSYMTARKYPNAVSFLVRILTYFTLCFRFYRVPFFWHLWHLNDVFHIL